MFSIWEALDRKAVRGECRRTNRSHAGNSGQNLAVGLGEQRHDLEVDGIDVCSESTIAVQVTTQPMSTLIRIGRRRQALSPPSHPVLG